MNQENPRVVVVDDEESFRRGLGRLLKAHGLAFALYDSAEAFLRDMPAAANGCVVLDVHMPGLNGLELQERLSEADCALPIVFLTGRGDIPTSVRAMKRGAQDFLTKPVDEDVLLGAIRKALEENRRELSAREQVRTVRKRIALLTEREEEVMRHVIAGKLNKQIAGELGVVEKTIKVHRARVMEKMQVGSVAELVRDCALAGIAPAGWTKVQ
jgi:FixJ family two-component response regulator